MGFIDILCSAAMVLGLCILPIIVILCIIDRDNKEEHNHDKLREEDEKDDKDI